MTATLALDIYGTLIDPLAVKEALRAHVGENAAPFAELWRTKQLEYSFRRGLMETYQNFTHVTRSALDYVCEVFHLELSNENKATLMKHYRKLDAFADVAPTLKELKQNGVMLHAFSNGVTDDIEALLEHADLSEFISSIVSADEVQTFKPDPRIYQHFLSRAKVSRADTWLVSSNPFDVIGAAACGLHTVWVKRNSQAVFDPWEQSPTEVVGTLTELLSLPQFQ